MSAKRIVVIGGSAAGPKAAAKARRMDEHAEVIVLQKDPDLSMASCGFPYYVGGCFDDRNMLLSTPTGVIRNPQYYLNAKAIDARTNTEVTAIDRENRTVSFKDLLTGNSGKLDYDRLIIATGSIPKMPPVSGTDLKGVTALKSIQDADYLRRVRDDGKIQKAVIIGGGLIGIETCEALRLAGIEITVIEMLPQLLAKWEEGYDVVQTIRLATEGVSWFKNFTSRAFYWLMNAMSKVHVQEGGSDFRLLDRRVVQSFRLFRERARFIRGMISAIGFRQEQIEFVAPPRHAGVSKFSLRKMMTFALDGITAYSKLPLRFAFYTGVVFGMASLGLTLHVLYIKFFTEEAVPGWATIAASILLLGGLQLAFMGIIGEYVGRIFEEVKQRPLYLVREEINRPQKGVGGE